MIEPSKRFLPTSVQKSYFMLSDAERKVLNTALEKYRPGQSTRRTSAPAQLSRTAGRRGRPAQTRVARGDAAKTGRALGMFALG
jgi:hypothetical protein